MDDIVIMLFLSGIILELMLKGFLVVFVNYNDDGKLLDLVDDVDVDKEVEKLLGEVENLLLNEMENVIYEVNFEDCEFLKGEGVIGFLVLGDEWKLILFIN